MCAERERETLECEKQIATLEMCTERERETVCTLFLFDFIIFFLFSLYKNNVSLSTPNALSLSVLSISMTLSIQLFEIAHRHTHTEIERESLAIYYYIIECVGTSLCMPFHFFNVMLL